jgi:hypothetical protein
MNYLHYIVPIYPPVVSTQCPAHLFIFLHRSSSRNIFSLPTTTIRSGKGLMANTATIITYDTLRPQLLRIKFLVDSSLMASSSSVPESRLTMPQSSIPGSGMCSLNPGPTPSLTFPSVPPRLLCLARGSRVYFSKLVNRLKYIIN